MGAHEDRLATHQASGQLPEAAARLQKATAPGGAEDPRAPAPRAEPHRLLLHLPAPFAAAAAQRCSGAQPRGWKAVKRARGSGLSR